MEREELTRQILLSISKHLSNRAQFKDVEYVVLLGRFADNHQMTIDVDAYCYPDIHRKKITDRQTLIEHVWIEHFYELLPGHDIDKYILPGVYQYQFNLLRTRRHWVALQQEV